ncbi:MAG: AsmA-like C-terminal region-containing protein, partial [Flavobacteriales bacterium]|nr:AsmA-like C-terminal region-containing protein [Flavobacteriales bacterium]
PGRQKGVLDALKARAFDGGVAAHGGWDLESIELEGAVVDVDVSSFLEGTAGLGQNTLLPSHLRGRAWAEGILNHHFGKAPNLAWETDLNVRLEEAELLDFDLLQRIPETLKAEGKYRFISDAEDLSKRLMRVRFEPLEAQVSLSRGVFNLEPTEVVSDAMNVGIAGWQRLSGGMDYTLDFALRDLKSDREEFGVTADDGLGHRFFLAIGGTLDAPEFGYDRTAHKSHRQGERRSALGRLKGLILGEQEAPNPQSEAPTDILVQDSLGQEKGSKGPTPRDFDDDDDDFSP